MGAVEPPPGPASTPGTDYLTPCAGDLLAFAMRMIVAVGVAAARVLSG